MEVRVLSSKLVKPAPRNDDGAREQPEYIPLSVFDKVTYQIQMAIIFAFAPPAPTTAALEKGLAAALAHHRALAGQLVHSCHLGPAVVLNDRGARVVEARVDADLVDPEPNPQLLGLHPDRKGRIDEIVVLQLTRFRCGSLAVGFTCNHAVADGRGTSNFLLDWGRATRGLDMGNPPVYHHEGLFNLWPCPSSSSAQFQFDHRNREYCLPSPTTTTDVKGGSVVVHKAHFTEDWIARLRATTAPRHFSRFEIILAHLWRATTRARGLEADHNQATNIRISVDGRHRLGVPAEYGNNLVLWAFPRATVGELLTQPLSNAAQLIHDEVAKVADAAYFRSFLRFASSGAVQAEGLAPSTELNGRDALCPDLEVHSWLTLPFHDLDLGTGKPAYVLPNYCTQEGLIYLMPSGRGDRGVDAIVAVFEQNLKAFKKNIHRMDGAATTEIKQQ